MAVEGIDRTQAGSVLSRIQIGVVRRAIEIDHIARMGGDYHRRANFFQKIIQRFQMPVGIGQLECGVGHADGYVFRHMGAHMGHRYQQRRSALAKFERGGEGR